MVLNKCNDDVSIFLKESLELHGAENVSIYNMDTGCRVIYAVENGREHVSISHKKRYPNWDEIKFVRYKLMKPDATIAQILPPKNEYVNIHSNCFHLFEIIDNGIDMPY